MGIHNGERMTGDDSGRRTCTQNHNELRNLPKTKRGTIPKKCSLVLRPTGGVVEGGGGRPNGPVEIWMKGKKPTRRGNLSRR